MFSEMVPHLSIEETDPERELARVSEDAREVSMEASGADLSRFSESSELLLLVLSFLCMFFRLLSGVHPVEPLELNESVDLLLLVESQSVRTSRHELSL